MVCYIFVKSETFSTSFVYITDERKTANLTERFKEVRTSDRNNEIIN